MYSSFLTVIGFIIALCLITGFLIIIIRARRNSYDQLQQWLCEAKSLKKVMTVFVIFLFGGGVCAQQNYVNTNSVKGNDNINTGQTITLTQTGNVLGVKKYFQMLPKGGDLHNHLSGAASFEKLLDIGQFYGYHLVFTGKPGKEKSFCGFAKDKSKHPEFESSGCGNVDYVTYKTIQNVRKEMRLLIMAREALTILPSDNDGENTGFNKFNLVFNMLDDLTDRPSVMQDLVKAIMEKAYEENVSYLELKVNPIGRRDFGIDSLGNLIEVTLSIKETAKKLKDAIDKKNAEFKTNWGHPTTSNPRPAWAPTIVAPWLNKWGEPVEVRFIVQGKRFDPEKEGAESGLVDSNGNDLVKCNSSSTPSCLSRLEQGYALTAASTYKNLFVGLDLVGLPETNYKIKRPIKKILNQLKNKYGEAKITLHAGETNKPIWRHHITEAIDAGANRIGHGFNLQYSESARQLVCNRNNDSVDENDVLLEISLSSNLSLSLIPKYINHPFLNYLRGNMCNASIGLQPISLCTDNAGIFDTDLSNEFFIAATTFGLKWKEIKHLVENSIKHSFVDPVVKAKLKTRLNEQLIDFKY